MRLTIPRTVLLGVLMALLVVPATEFKVLARSQAGNQQQSPPPPQQPQQQQPQEQQKSPQEQQKPPEYTLSIQAPAVNVDVVVTDEHGDILSGFKKENFRVLDNGVPQTITNFGPSDAPVTIVMLVEYSALYWGFYAYTAQYWGYEFLNHLKKNDWVALVTYDMRNEVVTDFTQNKEEVKQAIATLGFPGFREANLFDALLDTLDRLQEVKGKKSIFVLATGYDTFSKHILDNVLKRLKQTDVTIFAVGTAEPIMNYRDATGRVSGVENIGYLQAKNQLNNFANLTGGYAWFPRFWGEMPSIFESLAAFLRNQYNLAYTPENVKMDGKYHKIKVELVGNDGQPLTVTNQKGKKLKCRVYAREGYEAPKVNIGLATP